MKYYEHCKHCGEVITYPRRVDRKYCDKKCRQAAYRKRKSGRVTFTSKRKRGFIKERKAI